MATSTASIGGLASGLDTASIISQLMQVEAQTQTRLKSRLSTEQSSVKSLQDLNAKLATLTTNAESLGKAASWNPLTVTSSSDKVSVAATVKATAGPVSFTVNSLAGAHKLAFASSAALSATVTSGSTSVTLDQLDGTTKTIETGNGTLQGLINGLNAPGTGVRASTVRLDDGTYRLSVTSSATGAASDFTLKNLDGSDLLGGATVTAGVDASITVGTDTLHSSSNTFASAVNGLDITLGTGVTTGTVVDVSVEPDGAAAKKQVKDLVDAINSITADIDKLTAYNATTKVSGALAGDASVRTLRNALTTAIYPSDGTSMAGVGIQVDRYGKLTFDEAAFDTAYAADPSAVAAKFTQGTVAGFAARIQTVAKNASNSVDGSLTTSINSRQTGISRMQDSISDWDNRLELRKDTLTRQFASLETALNKMNSQSGWLSSQISSLSSSS